MTSHVGLMMVFAAGVATVFATLLRDHAIEQVRLGSRLFGGLVGGAYLFGWVMSWIFG